MGVHRSGVALVAINEKVRPPRGCRTFISASYDGQFTSASRFLVSCADRHQVARVCGSGPLLTSDHRAPHKSWRDCNELPPCWDEGGLPVDKIPGRRKTCPDQSTHHPDGCKRQQSSAAVVKPSGKL